MTNIYTMYTELKPNQIQKVLKGIAIPPQPQVLVDLQMEQLNPDCKIEEISRLISQDVGLSGSILKTVNSPFYKLSNTITSIQQAVSILGVKSVVNLVNAHSIRGALSDEDVISLGRFWDNAMEIALTAATIAKQIGLPNSDEAYTLGLFHNSGIPLLMSRFENYLDLVEEAYARKGKRITITENENLSTNHAVVGYYVAKSWNMPLYFCQAIHEHHQVSKSLSMEGGDSRKKMLLAVLKMAEHCCATHKVLGNEDTDYEWESVADIVLLCAGLSSYEFDNLKLQITEMGFGSTFKWT